MDYDGQARAEKLSRIIILLFGAVGFMWGYIIQQFSETVRILGAGFVLAAILTIPPWPIYKRKALQWIKPRPVRTVDGESTTESKKKKKDKWNVKHVWGTLRNNFLFSNFSILKHFVKQWFVLFNTVLYYDYLSEIHKTLFYRLDAKQHSFNIASCMH